MKANVSFVNQPFWRLLTKLMPATIAGRIPTAHNFAIRIRRQSADVARSAPGPTAVSPDIYPYPPHLIHEENSKSSYRHTNKHQPTSPKPPPSRNRLLPIFNSIVFPHVLPTSRIALWTFRTTLIRISCRPPELGKFCFTSLCEHIT